MTLALACICLALGYFIGYLLGWMRGVEHTRTYIDPDQRAMWARRRRDEANEELRPQ